MFPLSKVSKHSVSPAVVEGKKKDREKEQNKLPLKKKLPPDAKSRFGKEFLTKYIELLQSKESDSCQKMRAMYEELAAYYKEHDLTIMWISDDEVETKEMTAPVSKKMHQDANKAGDVRCVNNNRMVDSKGRIRSKPESKNPSLACTSFSSSLLTQFELSDDSDDNSRRHSAFQSTNFKLCHICLGAVSVQNSLIVECEGCSRMFHQKCARPEITPLQAKDPRFLFICSECKEHEDNKDGMQKYSDEKIQPRKPDNDFLLTFASYAAKRVKKTLATGSGSSLQCSGGTMNKIIPTFVNKDRK